MNLSLPPPRRPAVDELVHPSALDPTSAPPRKEEGEEVKDLAPKAAFRQRPNSGVASFPLDPASAGNSPSLIFTIYC